MSNRNSPTAARLGLALMAAACAALLVLEVYQDFWQTPELRRSRDLVVHSYEVILTAKRLESTIKEAESRQRSFLLAGEPEDMDAYRAAMREMGTSELTRVMEAAVVQHQPPMVAGRRIKLRYAHLAGRSPLTILVHGNQTDRLPDSYRRYLINEFRSAFELKGLPLRVEFKTGENPFKGRKNELTGRQMKKRRRIRGQR